METFPIFKELIPEDISLNKIHLDPNNPRFVSMNWDHITDDRIAEEAVQKEIQLKLEREFSVDRLVMNIEVNGYLPIDRVIVRKFDDDKYVVLEGNRRICAAKILEQKFSAKPESVSEEIIETIREIPCLVYTGSDSEASWIFQGLRHIMGIQEWSAFNKARLIVTLMEEEELSLTDVGKRFGLTPFGAGQWMRGFYAFKQAKESSDYSREMDERAYPYFQELFSRSTASLREWLDWKEADKNFANELNFNEFLGWLYPRDIENIDETIDTTTIKGDWKNRKLVKSADLRTLSYLLSKSSKEFELFRSEGDLEKAYTLAIQKQYEEEAKRQSDPVEEIYDSLRQSTKLLENMPFKMLREGPEKEKLFVALDALEKAISEIRPV
jgi:hypothetical protein